MNKPIGILIVITLLMSVASAAILTEYLRDERTVEVKPWMSFEVNYDSKDIIYGDSRLYDYINITSHKKYSSICEIKTEISFNGEELIDQEGIYVSYSVESGSGALVKPKDTNDNGLPEVSLFGTQDSDGTLTIRRNTMIHKDLVPGTYKITTILIPYQGNT